MVMSLKQTKMTFIKRSCGKYRVGINRNDTYQTVEKRKKLFNGYDTCVIGKDPHRRYASTIHRDDIRDWMEQFQKGD